MSSLHDVEKDAVTEKDSKSVFVSVDEVDTDSEGTAPEKLVKQFSCEPQCGSSLMTVWSSLGMALLILNVHNSACD